MLRYEIYNELNLQYNFDKLTQTDSDDEDIEVAENMLSNKRKVCIEITRLQSKDVYVRKKKFIKKINSY